MCRVAMKTKITNTELKFCIRIKIICNSLSRFSPSYGKLLRNSKNDLLIVPTRRNSFSEKL